MKHRSRIALLLLAAMLLSLAGCAAKPEARAYEAPMLAFEALLNNPDAAWPDAVQAAVGDFCGEELTRIAQLMIRTGITTDEIMTDRMLGEYRAVYGYDCTFDFTVPPSRISKFLSRLDHLPCSVVRLITFLATLMPSIVPPAMTASRSPASSPPSTASVPSSVCGNSNSMLSPASVTNCTTFMEVPSPQTP